MNKILSTLQDPKNWIEAFLDNKEKYSEDFVKALEFINEQKLSNIVVDDFNGRPICFVFEYENWDDLPESIRKLAIVSEDDTYENSITVDFLGIICAHLYLYDISKKSDFIYEDFMHSLGDSDKNYICINIDID